MKSRGQPRGSPGLTFLTPKNPGVDFGPGSGIYRTLIRISGFRNARKFNDFYKIQKIWKVFWHWADLGSMCIFKIGIWNTKYLHYQIVFYRILKVFRICIQIPPFFKKYFVILNTFQKYFTQIWHRIVVLVSGFIKTRPSGAH